MSGRMVVMGCSLGGLEALRVVLAGLPSEFDTPVALVQHRSADSGAAFITILQQVTHLEVVEAEDKLAIRSGRVVVAPPAYHLLVEEDHFALSTDAPIHYARPSIDVLFVSAADAFGSAVVGVVMTGASDDGADGLARIHARGGCAIVQSPQHARCAVMPRASIRAVPTATVVPLEEIAHEIVATVRSAGALSARPVGRGPPRSA